MSKVVSLARARLACLTPEERAERRTAMRLHREAVRSNEMQLDQRMAVIEAEVTLKVSVAVAIQWARTGVEPDEEAIVAVTRSAVADLKRERPELFIVRARFVPPRPLS